MIAYREISEASLTELGKRNASPVKVVPVPFTDWAKSCMGRGGETGLAYGWHVIAAGRAGEGKTQLAVNVAAHAIENAQAVTFHSLEMSWDELSARTLAVVSGKPAHRLSPGKHFERETFQSAIESVKTARGKILVNESTMHRLRDLLDGIRFNFEEHDSRLHIVDYLQLAWVGDHAKMYDRITEVSHAVRQLAKDLGIVTFCLSQFNRETTKVRNERPSIAGLAGGSSLENDADQVLLLDHSRRELFRDPRGRVQGWDGWLLLDKNRHGPAAEIPIRYVADTGRIRQRLDDEICEGKVRNGSR